MRLPALLFAAAFALAAAAEPARGEIADVVIQAGHQGRPQSCARLHVRACNLGTANGDARERAWTPVVADEAARVLRAAGYTVLRRPADYDRHDTAAAAVFLHFDGALPCRSGASVGFPQATPRAFALRWEARYRRLFPYRFVGENFTRNEREYYGFRKVDAPRKLLIEFGEMTCPQQFRWLAPRLTLLGDEVAAFLREANPR